MAAVKRQMKQSSRKTNTKRPVVGWGSRIELARLQIQASMQKRLSLDDFGAIVANQQGRKSAYAKGTVSGWIAERNEPRIAVFEAIAKLAACDPYWIVWGVGDPPLNAALVAFAKLNRPSDARKRGGEG